MTLEEAKQPLDECYVQYDKMVALCGTLQARIAELEKECIASPTDEAAKPKLGDDAFAQQYANDTLSGRSRGGRFPWGQRNLARAYLNAMNRIAKLESEQCAACRAECHP